MYYKELMIKFFITLLFTLFFYSIINAEESINGDYIVLDNVAKNCDFMGDAKLNINYKHISVKAMKWQWKETSPIKKKTFKGKFKKNYIDINISAKEIGSKHSLIGKIENNKIDLIFSSTHEEANKRYGGCSFQFIKN